MKRNAMRLLSLAICLVMVLSMLPVASFAAGMTTVYCQADSWSSCNAYWWGSSDANPNWPGNAMSKNEDGIWCIDIPADAAGLVFNDGSSQTTDLTVPADEKVMYVVGNNVWTTYGKVDVEIYDYYVAGESALCGDNWCPNSPANGMTDEDDDGIYTIAYRNVAAGSYQLKITDGTWANNWGADEENYILTLSAGAETVEISFDSATGLISVTVEGEAVEEPEKPDVNYYIAGSMNEWYPCDKNYILTDNGDGTYSLNLNLTAGTHEMKITAGTWDKTWDDNGQNYVFTLSANGVVTVSFNPASGAISVTGETVEEKVPVALEIQSVHVAGSAGLCGTEWDQTGNPMTGENGVYTLTFTNVAAGYYDFKFAANGAWDINWGCGVNMESGVSYDAWFNGANSSLVVGQDGATVILTLDLSAMDIYTGEGAKCSAVVENAPELITEVIAEGFAEFSNASDAFAGETVSFVPVANGTVTVEILSCDPGYYVDVYSGGEWMVDFSGTAANTAIFDVEGGNQIEILICSYNVISEFIKEAVPGSVAYKVTYLSSGEEAGGDAPELPDDPLGDPGSSMDNPKLITQMDWTFIPGNTTVWYLYDNYQNMMENGVYSMMLRINSSADYGVTYRGMDVPVDEDGFVNYEMMDMIYMGQYLFSVTNNSDTEYFFGIEVANRPAYINNGDVLTLGSNDIVLDASAVFTLYEFGPEQTGVYRITAAEGVVGNWGSAFNPVDNTPDKTSTLEWTCTAVGQALMVGFTGADTTVATVERIGDYNPSVEVAYTIYENVYDFSYVMPENPQVVDIDLLDGGEHEAFLGNDGFYHYGSACGPVMVADLSAVQEINIEDAYHHGGLRVWILDGNGQTLAKIDYNEAMYEYYEAGLVPVTGELGMMISQIGENKMWWNANGFVFGETVPEDLSKAWMQLCGYLKGSEGHSYENGTCVNCGEADPDFVPTAASVSGTVTSGKGTTGIITVELWLEGGETAAYTAATEDGNYTIEGVAPGAYTMKVSKASHVKRSYAVTVDNGDVKLDAKICLLGDVNGDGRITAGDVAQLFAHVKQSTLLTDAYAMECANANGGGLNIGDVATIYAHVKGSTMLF